LSWFEAILWLCSGLLIALVLLPLVRLLTAVPFSALKGAAASAEIRDALTRSLVDATITAVIATVLGAPLGYLLARRSFPGRTLVEAIVDLPLAVPHTVAGIALLLVYGRAGWVGAPASHLGVSFYGADPGIVVAMLFVSAPFAVDSAKVAFGSLDPGLERAARSLGARPGYTFRRITLPLASRGVLAGTVLVYARSISEFGALAILAYYPATAPVEIYSLFLRGGLTDSAAAAVLLLIVTLATFLVLRVLVRGRLWGDLAWRDQTRV
jgi:molybdate/tungstate transport system permease protein